MSEHNPVYPSIGPVANSWPHFAHVAGCFVIAAAALTYCLVTLLIPEWRRTFTYVESECVIVDKKLHRSDRLTWSTYLIRYSASGNMTEAWAMYDGWHADTHGSETAIYEGYAIGKKYKCYCNPDDSGTAVMTISPSPAAYIVTSILFILFVLSPTWSAYRMLYPFTPFIISDPVGS